MQIFCYTIQPEYLKLIGICENASTILWTQNFYEGDTFTIRLPATLKNISLFANHNVIEVFKNGNNESKSYYCGVVNNIVISRTVSGEELVVSGKGPDGFFEQRILREFSTEIYFLANLQNNAKDERRFYATQYANNADVKSDLYMRNEVASKYIKAIGQKHGIGLRSFIEHNAFSDGEHVPPFIVIQSREGVNYSIAQTDNKQLVFSDLYENVADFEYEYSEIGTANAIVTYSEMQFNKEKKIFVSEFTNLYYEHNLTTTSYERFEKASKITPVTKDGLVGSTETDEMEIWTVLDEEQTLKEAFRRSTSQYSSSTDFFNCQLILPPSYSELVKIGDIVTINNSKWGLTSNKRLTQIIEMYSPEEARVVATLGEPYPAVIT